MKKTLFFICSLIGLLVAGTTMADESVVYIYDANNTLLGSPSGAARIEFADGNLVVRSGEGVALATQPLSAVDYFALADNGIHNTVDALTTLATSDVRVTVSADGIALSAPTAILAVEAYSADGRLVAHASNLGTEARLSVAVSGPIVVRVSTATGVSMFKLIKK